MPKLLKYIIHEHKFYHHSLRQLRNLDPRIILHNADSDDETLTVRLAIQNGMFETFQFLWERYGELFTDKEAIVVLRFILFFDRTDFI
jgi:hypothetical protein